MSTYFQVHDDMVERPDLVDLSPNAWCLWLHGRAYCSRNLTDGYIPSGMLSRLSPIRDTESAAHELTEHGLWTVSPTGWEDTEYLELCRSRAQVESDRAGAAERKRRSREKQKTGAAPDPVTPEVTNKSHRDNNVTHTVEDPDPDIDPKTPPPPPGVTETQLSTGPEEEERVDQVLKAIADIRQRQATTPIKNPSAWRRTVIADARAEHEHQIRRLLASHKPNTPPALIAARTIGERAPGLDHHEAQPERPDDQPTVNPKAHIESLRLQRVTA